MADVAAAPQDRPAPPSHAGAWVFWIVAVVAVAAVLLATTFSSENLQKLAKSMADDHFSALGRFGIVLAGLLAPIAYVAKAVMEWFVGLLGFGGRGHKDDEIEKRTDALEAEMKRLRADVAAIDVNRTRAIEQEQRRAAELQAQLDPQLQRMRELDEEIRKRLERLADTSPPSEAEKDAAIRQAKERTAYTDIFARERAP